MADGKHPIWQWLQRYWFFTGIAAALVAGLVWPSACLTMKRWHVISVGIFVAFFISGLTLQTRQVKNVKSNLKALTGALASSLVLFPALAFLLCRLCFANHIDLEVGTLIIAVAPVTVASGTVMTGIAGGNIPLSLFICISGNFLAIFTVPLSLNVLLRFGVDIDLPAFEMVKSLFYTAILPTLAGQLVRLWLQDSLRPYHRLFSVLSQLVVLMIIFNAVAASSQRLISAGLEVMLIIIFMVFLHGLILALNFGLSRLLRLDPPSTAAFTIHTSQKTMTISYVVWSGYFAANFPLAMIPGISYHLIQMIADTFVAHRLRIWSGARTRNRLRLKQSCAG